MKTIKKITNFDVNESYPFKSIDNRTFNPHTTNIHNLQDALGKVLDSKELNEEQLEEYVIGFLEDWKENKLDKS